MPSRKAAVAADSQKKRKRDKAEEVVRLKKRKGQTDEEEMAESPKKKNGGAGHNSQLAQPTTRAIADQKTTWKLSEPMGGAMADIDPVFSTDEEYVVVND
jgi:hypothetical protein